MKAIFVVPGPQGAVYEYRQVPAPAPKAGEVLVRVHATGTNRGELLARPLIRSSNPKLLPTIGGIEFAGEIVALSPGVVSWKAGDRVMGRAPGSYAELVAVNQHALMRIPDTLTYPEAASIPNVFVTAHDAIVLGLDGDNAEAGGRLLQRADVSRQAGKFDQQRLRLAAQHRKRRDRQRYIKVGNAVRQAGFAAPDISYWGAVRPRMRSRLLITALAAAEKIIAPSIVARYLGVLSFSARKEPLP